MQEIITQLQNKINDLTGRIERLEGVESAGADASITLNELATTPAAPTQDTQARMYVKDDKIIFTFDSG